MVRSFFFLPFDRSVLGCCVESVSWFHLLGQLRSCLCDDEHLHAAAALNVKRMFFPPPFPLYTRPAHITRVSLFLSHFFFFCQSLRFLFFSLFLLLLSIFGLSFFGHSGVFQRVCWLANYLIRWHVFFFCVEFIKLDWVRCCFHFFFF